MWIVTFLLGPSAQCRSDSSATAEAGGRGREMFMVCAKESRNGMGLWLLAFDGRIRPYFTAEHLPVSY